MTDYRQRVKSSNDRREILLTGEEYQKEITQKGLLDPIFLASERKRFEVSVLKLVETNEELKADSDLFYIIDENKEVIERLQGYIRVLNEMLGESNSVYL